MSGSIGVLLPARIETRFDRLDDGSWKLRVLVVPGEASVDLHDPGVRHDELDRLEAAAEVCDGLLAEAEGEGAFESLAQEVGAGRALWLVRTRFLRTAAGWSVDRSGAVRRDETAAAPATLRGLPGELQVWAETPSGDVLLRTLRPRNADLPITPPRTDLPPEERDEVFWASWTVLRRSGLAGAVNLTAHGVEPEDIRRLLVVGVGESPAAPLFAAHAHAGNAALLAPGTPTNVTAGAPGHPQPTPVDHHALLLPPPVTEGLVPPDSRASDDLARALTGVADGLPRLVGGDVDHRGPQRGLVRVVWPALWGHAAQDLWGPTDRWAAPGLGRWIEQHLLPEGPFPTLLVDDQPYGVLPLTPLDRAGDGSDPVEDLLAPALAEALRSVAGLASEERDTVMGADGERLLRVLGRTPTSRGYAWRWSMPLRYLGLAEVEEAQANAVAPFLNAAGHDARQATDAPVTVDRRRDVAEANAEPRARPDDPTTAAQWDLLMQWLEQAHGAPDLDSDRVREALGARGKDEPVRVLMAWLWWRLHPLRDTSLSLNAQLEGLGDPWPDSLLFHLARLSFAEVWRWGWWASEGRDGPPQGDGRSLHQYGDPWPPTVGDPSWVQEIIDRVLEALHGLAAGSLGAPGDLDRATAALLDTATHRLDPWAVAPAWRRLEARDDARRVLGLYGFVDDPFRGEPGLGDRGVTLAPSPDQAKTAAIVRDRAAAHHHDGLAPGDLKDVTLDSERVRLTLRVTRAVREGAHPAEALGREVERLLPGTVVVRRFREVYPAHRTDAQRRTCDGLKVIAAVTADTLTTDTGFTPDGETARRFALLAELPADLADLLVLEAVHDTVTGGAAQAAQALDAAAGLAAPPDLRYPATVAGGVPLRTTVHLALPEADVGPVAAPADAVPAVAAHLAAAFPDPAGPGWTWTAGGATVTLSGLGLVPGDLVAIDDDALLAVAADRLGVDPARVVAPPDLREARRRVDLLGRCRPAPPPVGQQHPDVPALAGALRAAARRLATDLEALDPDTPLPPALAAPALRWGVRGRAGDGAARLRELVGQPDSDPVEDLARLTGGAGGVPGSPARRGPVLVPDGVAPGPAVGGQWHEVFGRVRETLRLVPDGWAWRAHADDDTWTGRPDEGGQGRVADVVVGPDGWRGGAVSGVLDAWTETLPERDVPLTAAFSFRTPRARAPQAILLAVPTGEGEEIDVDTARDVVHQAALLARARSVPPGRLGGVGALLPSAHLPAAERGGLQLGGIDPGEEFSRGLHVRLEPAPADVADLDAALRAEVGDPVWMLARQWQLGEHAGADASSPVRYKLSVSQTPLRPPVGRAFADPRRLPGEVVLEAATRDVLLPGPVAGARRDPWDATGLWHGSELRVGVPRVPVAAPEHDGGVADWWSLDLGPLLPDPAATADFTPVVRRRRFAGLPGRMDYPGAPEPGWFTLEDPRRVVTGHLPDPSHAASLFFLDVVAGHATDWYLASLATPPGHVARLHELEVVDSFGDTWPPEGEDWRSEADAWTTPFRTRGLEPLDLVAWFATPPPLEGDVLERVLLGVDEDADLLWVVEERVDGQDAPGPVGGVAPGAGSEVGDRLVGTPPVRYRLLAPSPGPWHPYPAPDPADDEPRRFRQGRLRVDQGGEPVDNPLPDPTSRFLADRRGGRLPEIDPAAVPAGGLRLERRWVLARARDGLPVVWQQRRRIAPRTAPAYAVGHDRTEPR